MTGSTKKPAEPVAEPAGAAAAAAAAPTAAKPAKVDKEDDDKLNAFIVVPIVLFSALAYGYWWLYHNVAHADWFTGQSMLTPTLACVAYLTFVFQSAKLMESRGVYPIKNFMLVYNVYQTCLNIANVSAFIWALYKTGFPVWGQQMRIDAESYDFSFWIWVHYSNKYLELLDTVFMVLRKKFDQVSFLHVYHHALLIWAWFVVVHNACGGDAYFGALANSFIHVVMYSYYALALFKISVPWKKYITQLQMVQFCVCLTHSLYVAYFNYYPRWLCFVEVWVMTNMLVLFGNFYAEQYASKKVRWTIIDGKKYNVSEFMKRHPGGADMLMLAVGRDATAMYHMYHRRLDTANSVLAKLPVIEGEVEARMDGSRLEGSAKYDPPASVGVVGKHTNMEGPLYTEIRARVNKYFAEKRLNSRGGMVTKSLVLVSVTALTYYLCIFQGMLYLAPLFGWLLAVNGFAIQHDANHGAFHTNPLVNRIAGLVDDVIGGSALMWRHQHNVAHHAHPNDRHLDADTYSNFPIMRTNPAMPVRSYLRFQHLYFPFVYCWIGIAYLIGDLQCFIEGHYLHVRLQPLRFQDKVAFLLGKLFHITFMMVLPVYYHGWMALLKFYLVMELCGGLYLALCFAVSHNAENVQYNVASDMEWAKMQVVTSANWAPKSTFWLYAVGGLNFQVEHHLFPGVAHIHYPAIGQIVKQVCKEQGVPYNSHDSFFSLFKSHVRTLYKLGNNKKLD